MIGKFIKDNFVLILIFLVLIIFIARYLIKHNIVSYHMHKDTFNVLEGDIQNYLKKRKEFNERNILEKEKIEILEKDLEEVKMEIDKENEVK